MLNIALPKGRLGDQVYELLASVGYDCKSIYDENRKLVFEKPQTDWESNLSIWKQLKMIRRLCLRN